MKLLDGLGVAVDGLAKLSLQFPLLQVRVAHDFLHRLELRHVAVQLLAKSIPEALDVQVVVGDAHQRRSGGRRILEQPAQDESSRHILPCMETADQQGDQISRGPRQGYEVVYLVLFLTKLKPELAGVQGMDNHLWIIRRVRSQNLAAPALGARVDDLHVVLRDVDLQVSRVRVVLVTEMPHREAAGPGGKDVLQTHPRDGIELEGSDHTVGLSQPPVSLWLCCARDVHADVVRRRMVHVGIDSGDFDQVGPNLPLPLALQGDGPAVKGGC
mmetsp:Transcript_5530/g.10412  ORF Transcript_5530/g.10412 Transcript_5530/m.10412 type:complete len:271 (-) Transcript_5530:291-1103(-)